MTPLILSLALAAFGAEGERTEGPPSWRDPLRCGPNCLYAYLSLHGRPRALDEILARVPIGPEGATLKDLRGAAESLGVPSRAVKTTADRLGDWPLPAVAHLDVRRGHPRPPALTVMSRVHAEHPIFSAAVSGRVHSRLADSVRRLTANQRPSGYWTPDWFLSSAEPSADESYDSLLLDRARLAQATGHHLEWLRIAPADLAIPPEARRRAIAWCAGALERASAVEVEDAMCPYSHCFRMVKSYAAPKACEPGGSGP